MIDIPKEFLQEEIRCDYSVSEKMKKVWAVQLDLICELDRICRKYNIPYMASSGTLLGAVRHKGFIPWDDDIDIVMFRTDYERLTEVAEKELKYPYFLQDAYSDGFLRGFARLRNSETTAITQRYADRDINHGIYIDIFFLDSVPENKFTKKLWISEIKMMRILANAMFFENPAKKISLQKRITLKAAKLFYDIPSFARKYDRLCSRYNRIETENIGIVSFSTGNERVIWKRKWFEHGHYVPFEFIEINIPDCYDEILTHQYRDYMVMKRISTIHGTVLFDPDTPYKEFLKQYTPDEIEQMISEMNKQG